MLSEIYFINIFSCYVSYLFTLLFVPFLRQKFLILIQFITISLSIILSPVLFKNSLPIPWACHCTVFMIKFLKLQTHLHKAKYFHVDLGFSGFLKK